MSERNATESWDRRLPLYSYLEPLWAGRKVLEIGCGTGEGADYLAGHGAARVISVDAEQGPVEKARARFRRPNLEFRALVSLADLSKLGESFDVVVVPAADAALLRADLIAAWKRALTDGGHLVVAAGNADRTGAVTSGGAGYYQVTDALSPHFTRVQMFGQTPFLGVGMIEFDAPADGLRVDTRLLEGEGEPASHYVAVAGAGDPVPLGYALVQVPYAPVEARLRAAGGAAGQGAAARREQPDTRVEDKGFGARAKLDDAEGRISDLRRRLDDTTVQSESAMRIARAQSDEIEDLRARLRRSGEDRAALDAEIAKLRRALAEADEAVLALTRRTTEEMTAVAARLSASLRAPEDSAAGRAQLGELAVLRDQAEELRVRLVESEARAGAAERRLEETATAGRDREHETADLRARLRRAEDSLERERLAVSALQEQSRIAANEIEQLASRADALHGRDERIARLEGEKQDLSWRTAELEEKLRTAIARAVSAEATRGSPAGGLQAAPPPPPPPPAFVHAPAPAPSPALGPLKEELAEVRASRARAVEEFHRAAAAHVEELTRLQSSAAEQSVQVAELEESLRAAEAAAAAAAAEAAALRKGSRELEEADRSRRSRLAELEGKLLRLEHEKKAVVQAATGSEELERKLQAAETERETLRAERDQLRAQASARAAEAPARAGNGNGNGHPATAGWSADLADKLSADLAAIEEDLRAETMTLGSLEAALAAGSTPAPDARASDAGAAAGAGAPAAAPGAEGDSARALNTLANFRRRAQALRDEIEGYRRRLDELSPAEVSMLLDELGEGLAEFEA